MDYLPSNITKVTDGYIGRYYDVKADELRVATSKDGKTWSKTEDKWPN